MTAGVEPLRCARSPLFYPICGFFETPGGAAAADFPRPDGRLARPGERGARADFPPACGDERQYAATAGCRAAATGAPARGVH
ncbi:hypothetical protein CO709_20620 [Burkholderia thailandensis]|nr:hypothetical protein CO709_20620 [Burkholderia thailandensis]